jgi:hypothetical protein
VSDRQTRLKASVDQEYGMRFVDLFVDHTSKTQKIRVASSSNGAIAMTDHLKLLLTPTTCPNCQSPGMKRVHRWNIKQWFLKFAGRKVFLCADCGFKQTSKVGRWELETIATAVAVALVLLIMSIHWAFRQ